MGGCWVQLSWPAWGRYEIGGGVGRSTWERTGKPADCPVNHVCCRVMGCSTYLAVDGGSIA